jgi:hypothetical protein
MRQSNAAGSQNGSAEEQMNKVLLGLLVGAVLGAIDGGTAWFTPAVRSAIVGIFSARPLRGLSLVSRLGFLHAR